MADSEQILISALLPDLLKGKGEFRVFRFQTVVGRGLISLYELVGIQHTDLVVPDVPAEGVSRLLHG
jgi:hypothetical protein